MIPCKECNRLHWEIACAFISRDYAKLHALTTEENAHKKVCEVINSVTYKLLWQNAIIGTDIYPTAHWTE